MSFNKKTWTDRISEFITRRLLTKADGSTEQVTVSRDEGEITQEGTPLNAESFNDLEGRIESAFSDTDDAISQLNTHLTEEITRATSAENTLRVRKPVIPYQIQNFKYISLNGAYIVYPPYSVYIMALYPNTTYTFYNLATNWSVISQIVDNNNNVIAKTSNGQSTWTVTVPDNYSLQYSARLTVYNNTVPCFTI